MKYVGPGILLLLCLAVSLAPGCSRSNDRTYVPPNMVIGDQPTPYPTPYRPKYHFGDSGN